MSASEGVLDQKLALVATRTNSAVVIGDAAGCVEWVNPAFERITGFTAAEVVGKRLDGLGDLDELAIDHALARFRNGETSRLEVPASSRSGRRLWLSIEVQPLGGGEDAGFIVIATDVTERKSSEQALAESEERYRQLVELAPDPIGVHCDGHWAFLNSAAVQLLGAESAGELIGRAVMDFVHPDSRERVAERVQRVLARQESTPLTEVKILRLNGEVLNTEIAGAPIDYDGRPAVQLVTRNITPRRRAENERRASAARLRDERHHESLSTLAGGLGQDFKSLLATILADVDLAFASEPESKDVRERLLSIRRESLRAGRLTSQLLAYAGRASLVREPVEMSRLVMEASEILETIVSNRARLALDLAGDIPPVMGDPLKLRQVLVSLVENSAESMEGVEGTITVRTSVAETVGGGTTPKRVLHLEVIDSGAGMSRHTLSQVFDPFFSTRRAGRGLGLPAVQGIVRSHNGSLRLTSKIAAGTTVRVRLPCIDPGASRRRRRKRASPECRDRSLLLVEDDDQLRIEAQRILEAAGYRVRTASGGRAALRIFRAHAPEVGAVLLALSMPGIGGAETLREMRLVQPDVRVVLMTGYNDPPERVPLEDLSGFLPKPYAPPQLLEAVRRALER